MTQPSRRDFLKTSLAATALTGLASTLPAQASPAAKATDKVTLGKSGLQVTRLAFGTGSMGGQVQREIGQEKFNYLVRHAYDRGIRFFETAESYGDMHRRLGIALKGIPRDSYQLMSKVTTHEDGDPAAKFDELRSLAQTDYFDVMLLHWQHTPTWPTDSRKWQDGVEAAQEKKIILHRGASVHGLPALRQVPAFTWLDVAMIRMNHNGAHMDGEDYNASSGNVPEVVQHVHQAKAAGQGVISMKLVGEGSFNHQDRQKAMRYAFQTAKVDAVTVGYKSPQEVDEAIDNLNLALA